MMKMWLAIVLLSLTLAQVSILRNVHINVDSLNSNLSMSDFCLYIAQKWVKLACELRWQPLGRFFHRFCRLWSLHDSIFVAYTHTLSRLNITLSHIRNTFSSNMSAIRCTSQSVSIWSSSPMDLYTICPRCVVLRQNSRPLSRKPRRKASIWSRSWRKHQPQNSSSGFWLIVFCVSTGVRRHAPSKQSTESIVCWAALSEQ